MNSQLMKEIEASQIQKRPDVHIGDTVKLHIRITEGDKSRIQIFQGIVIAMKGSGLNETITVRKISSGVGVERIIPMHSPTLNKIEIIKRGNVRKSKLYYMRQRVGKKAMKISGAKLTDGKYDLKDEEVIVDEPVVEVDDKAEAPKEVLTDEVKGEDVVELKKETEVTEDAAVVKDSKASDETDNTKKDIAKAEDKA